MKKPIRFSQNFPITALIIILLIILTLIANLFLKNYSKPKLIKQSNDIDYSKEVLSQKNISPRPTSIPTAESYNFNKYFHLDDVTFSNKSIFYYKNKNIYLKKTDQNYSLSKEIVFAKNLSEITDYSVSSDRNYLAYTYKVGDLKIGQKYQAGGIGNVVDLKNISTGEIKNIFTSSDETGQVLSLSSSPKLNIIFISTDFGKIYYYNINDQKIVDITYSSDKTNQSRDNFCLGYKIIDQSQNNLLIRSTCYEGTVFYLYNYQTGTRTTLGGMYISGYWAVRFLDEGSFMAYEYDEDNIKLIGKYNLQNQLVQELPITKSSDKTPSLYYKYMNKDNNNLEQNYYLVSENEIIKNQGDIKKLKNNLIGEKISLVKVID